MRSIPLGVAVVLPLILLGVVSWTVDRERDRARFEADLERLEAFVEEEERCWNARDFDRAPAWGGEEAGSAFEAYASALAFGEEHWEKEIDFRLDLMKQPEDVDSARVGAMRRLWRSALDSLHRGAHRRDARPPFNCESDPAWPKGLRLLTSRSLVNAAVTEGDLRLAEGDGRGAVELTLDAATFATDVTPGGNFITQVIGNSLLAIATFAAWSDEDLARLGEEELALLGEGLARIDARCPVVLDGRAEWLFLAQGVLRAYRAPKGLEVNGESVSLWEDQAEGRLLTRATLRQKELWAEILAGGSQPWPERDRELTRIIEDWSSDFPEGSRWRTQWRIATGVERSLRQVAAELRALRHAVALHAGSESPPPPDPFGDGPLRVDVDGTVVLIRSVGAPGDRQVLSRSVTLPRER